MKGRESICRPGLGLGGLVVEDGGNGFCSSRGNGFKDIEVGMRFEDEAGNVLASAIIRVHERRHAAIVFGGCERRVRLQQMFNGVDVSGVDCGD